MKFLHVSWLKRSAENLGGVEKFATYLDRALTEAGHECRVIAWSDYPNRQKLASVGNPDAALLLGAWIEEAFEFDVAVSDGYWGAGITRHPVVPVVHGTWAQFHINQSSSPWMNVEVRAQHDAFNAPNAFPVACSAASARELEMHHRRPPAATILNGVDVHAFYPMKTGNLNAPPVVLHAANNPKKGSEIIPAIARELAPNFHVSYLAAAAGDEPQAFQRGDLFLHPSKHEGCSYALLEALATGLPIITSDVGFFADVPDKSVGRILPHTATVSQWAGAVREVWGNGVTPYREYARGARETATAAVSFETFKRKWIDFLEGFK